MEDPQTMAVNAEEGTPVLEIRDLYKTFRVGLRRKEVKAAQGISFTVNKGEVFGFLGPNGAGKTTTIKACMGLIRPTDGEVRLFGRSGGDLACRARIGYLPEHPYFYEYLKPTEILEFFGRLFGIPRDVRKARIEELLERVGLKDARGRTLRKFSKGMLQRVGIAQAMINDPDLLVLDEPLSGLDPIGRKEIRDILVDLRAQGKTIFFSSHILSDIETICDRVAIIHQGKMRDLGSVKDLVDPAHIHTEITFRGGEEGLLERVQGMSLDAVRVGEFHRLRVQGRSQEILQLLLSGGAHLESVQQKGESLEELFVRGVVRGNEADRAENGGGAI